MIIHQKKQNFKYKRKLEVESELGRANAQIFDELAWSQQPKERIESVSYQLLTSKMCTNLSYRKSAEMLNLVLHRDEEDSIKSRTLSDSMNRIGSKISSKLKEVSGKVLMMSGFNKETGLPEKEVVLSENIQIPNIQAKDTSEEQYIQNAIDNINTEREEKIPFNARELEIETNSLDCVYISIDDVGVNVPKLTISIPLPANVTNPYFFNHSVTPTNPSITLLLLTIVYVSFLLNGLITRTDLESLNNAFSKRML